MALSDPVGIQAHLLAVLIGVGLSFVGSMPPGMISLTVARTSMYRGMGPALVMAVGAGLVEGIQAWLSVSFISLFQAEPMWQQGFRWLAVPILLGAGLYYLRIPAGTLPEARPAQGRDFWTGVGVSALNVLAFPYWVIYGTYLQQQEWITPTYAATTALSIGVALGTILLLWGYAWLSQRLLARPETWVKWTHRSLAALLIGLGLWQLGSLVFM